MKKCFAVLSAFVLIILMACSKEVIAPEEIAKCYKTNPIEELPWLNDVVKSFQKPKSGPLIVSSAVFRNEVYIVVNNLTVSCPMCYIYNCQGETIGKLGIHYNTFTSEAKLIKVFLDKNY